MRPPESVLSAADRVLFVAALLVGVAGVELPETLREALDVLADAVARDYETRAHQQ